LSKKAYKTSELYCCFALNRLVQELDLDLGQEGLGSKVEAALRGQTGVTKSEIKYEMKTNNFMTNKVLAKLEQEGFVTVDRAEGGYSIKITKEGVMHVGRFNEFYWRVFHEHIVDHYRFRRMPVSFERLDR
jgi:predicted transcriptional regulator